MHSKRKKKKKKSIPDWEAGRRGAAVAVSAVSCSFRTGASELPAWKNQAKQQHLLKS